MALVASRRIVTAAAGSVPFRQLGCFVVGGAPVLGLGAANGGYFPRSWGVAALLLFWATALIQSVDGTPRLGRLDLAFVGALGLYLACAAVSLAWTASPPLTVLELQRGLVLLAGITAVLLIARRETAPFVLAGALLAIVALCGHALAERLFQDVFGPPAPRFFDAGVLSGEVGYSNALGSLAALGALGSLGLAVRARHGAVRAASAAALVLLLATLYLTLSRGAWLGLALGLVVALALDPARRLLFVGALALAPPAAGAVAAAASAPALVRPSPGAAAVSQGHRLALLLVLCMAAASGLALLVPALLERARLADVPARRVTLVAAVCAAALTVAAVIGLGGPVEIVRTVQAEFTAPAARDGPTARLFSLSGTRRHHFWNAAWESGLERPVLGAGAGTFQVYWLEHRPVRTNVRDAHNLYLETFAELGTVGLALLLAALAVPLVAAARARSLPFVSTTAGGYTVWLVQAGLDWLWEMAAVTLAALLFAAVLVVSARSPRTERRLGRRAWVAALAASLLLGLAAFGGLLGNSALAAAQEAFYAGDRERAAEQAKRARRWAPWASEPYRLVAELHLAEGRLDAAAQDARGGLDRDPSNWLLWYDLALATRGEERRAAVREVRRLNPRSFRVIALGRGRP